MGHPYLRWLKIHRYEGFEGVEIEFSPEENLILGVNGAGKTQLLRLLSAILELNFAALREVDFDVGFEFASDLPVTGGGSERLPATLRGRVANRRQTLEADRSAAPRAAPPNLLEATLVIRPDVDLDPSITITVRAGEITIECGGTSRRVALDLGLSLLDQVASADHPQEVGGALRWGADLIREDAEDCRILIEDVEFRLFQSGHYRVDDRRSRALVDLVVLALHGAFLSRRGAAIGGPWFSAASLEALLGPLRAESLTLTPKPSQNLNELKTYRGITLALKFDSGPTYYDLRLTFGQRRYLYIGLLSLVHPHHVFLIDELDNGLHPKLVEALMLLLQGRQRFFASHNKLVIDYTAFDSADDVQKKIHIVRRDDEGRQHVDKISDAEAAEVFEHIEVKIMHPSDVLQTEGLW